MFVAVMDAFIDGQSVSRVAKFQPFATEAAADAHVTANLGNFPLAFVVAKPVEPFSHWLIDMDAGTLTIDIPPPPPPRPESPEIEALRELATEIGPAAVAKIEARFGAKP